jgi:PAS domain S-box-containing protein
MLPGMGILPKKLGIQLMLLISIGLFAILAIYGIITAEYQTRKLVSTLENEAKVLSRNIASASAPYLFYEDNASLEQLLLTSAEYKGIVSIVVTDQNGLIQSQVEKDDGGHVQPKYELSKIDVPSHNSIMINKNETTIVLWHPINVVSLIGWLKITYKIDFIEQTRTEIYRFSIIAACMAFISSFIVLFLFLSRPMRALNEATRFASSLGNNSGEQMKMFGHSNEIDRLIAALNETSASLHQQSQSIHEKEDRIRLLLDSTAEAIYGVDNDGRFIFANSTCRKVFDLGKDDNLTGKKISVVFKDPIDAMDGVMAHIKSVIKSNESLHLFEEKVSLKNGNEMDVESRYSPIYNGDDVIGVVVSFINITRRKEAENKLRQLNRSLNMLSECNEIIARTHNATELLEKLCKAIVEWGGYYKSEAWSRANGSYKQIFSYASNINVRSINEVNQRQKLGSILTDPEPVILQRSSTGTPAGTEQLHYILMLPVPRPDNCIDDVICIYSMGIEFSRNELELMKKLAENIGFSLHAITQQQRW